MIHAGEFSTDQPKFLNEIYKRIGKDNKIVPVVTMVAIVTI
jgi:hypothetical protein